MEANATGEAEFGPLRLQFDCSVKLAFQGSSISSDGGLLIIEILLRNIMDQELQEEWDRVNDAVIAATFEEYGEPEFAALFRHENERFEQQHEKGRRQFKRRKRDRH